VALTAQLPPPRGTANPLKPVHELYGEVLLKSGRYDEAVAVFQASLKRTPNRPRSLLGLARTYAQLGDESSASEQYRKLASIWKGYDANDLQEAEQYLQTVQR
jgi:predicted Zn-dependent protease